MSTPSSHDPSQIHERAHGAIVVAVDGSEHAARAVRWAADQAALEHRRLLAVAIGELVEPVTAEEAVEEARRLHPDLEAEAVVLPGDARQVLIDLSAHAHLLVLGSRGRGGIRSLLLGSVSAAVSRHAACPVVVCRPPDEDESRNHGVLVGADAEEGSLPVVEFAFRQASLRGQPLTILHCFWDAMAAVQQYRESRGESAPTPDLEELRAGLSESVAGLAERYPDVAVTVTLKHGFVDEALAPHGSAWDLVVVGRRRQDSLESRVTGSLATSVVERSHSTVAVVPEG